MTYSLAEYYSLTLFISVALLLLLESGRELRREHNAIGRRWGHTGVLYFIGLSLYQFVFPFTCLTAAYLAESQNRGLSQVEGWQWLLVLAASVLLLDFIRWFWHYLCHRVPFLWRIHRVHHTDQNLDVFTALRFHPIELVCAAALNATLIYLAGIPVIIVFIYDVVAISINNFNHSNINLGDKWERRLGRFIFTPRLHAIHHDAQPQQYLTNLGGFWVCWDKMFGSFQSQTLAQAQQQQCGLKSYHAPRHSRVHWMLINPLLRPAHDEKLIERPRKPDILGSKTP